MIQSQPESQTFEEALAQLEVVVRDLEDGQTGLEEALSRYELGVGLIKRCQMQLRQAEMRIQLLTGIDEKGQPTLQPFPSPSAEFASADGKPRTNRSPELDCPF